MGVTPREEDRSKKKQLHHHIGQILLEFFCLSSDSYLVSFSTPDLPGTLPRVCMHHSAKMDLEVRLLGGARLIMT